MFREENKLRFTRGGGIDEKNEGGGEINVQRKIGL